MRAIKRYNNSKPLKRHWFNAVYPNPSVFDGINPTEPDILLPDGSIISEQDFRTRAFFGEELRYYEEDGPTMIYNFRTELANILKQKEALDAAAAAQAAAQAAAAEAARIAQEEAARKAAIEQAAKEEAQYQAELLAQQAEAARLRALQASADAQATASQIQATQNEALRITQEAKEAAAAFEAQQEKANIANEAAVKASKVYADITNNNGTIVSDSSGIFIAGGIAAVGIIVLIFG